MERLVNYNKGNIIVLFVNVIALVWCLNTCFQKSQSNITCISLIIYAAFLFTETLFLFNRIFAKLLLVSFLISVCVYEVSLGYYQLLILRHIIDINNTYSIIGTFDNSSLFGGFISVSICMLIALMNREDTKPQLVLRNIICNISERRKTGNMLSSLMKLMEYVFLLLALLLLVLLKNRAGILATCVSMILLFRKHLCHLNKKLKFGIIVIVVLGGIGMYFIKKPSADSRLFVDKICLRSMKLNAWKGAGQGCFGRVYGESQYAYFKQQIVEKGEDDLDWTVLNRHDRIMADCPDNAFNEYLFLGIEFGLIKMLLFMGVLICAIIESLKHKTIWGYGVLSYAVFALFSYPLHIWQFQVMLSVLIAACFFDGSTDKIFKLEKVIVLIIWVIPAIAVVVKFPEMIRYKKAESAWTQSEYWYNNERYDYVVEDCDTLFPYLKHNQRFLFAYGQSLNKIGSYEKSDSILRVGTEISCDPMFWNVMGNNSLAMGRYREAEYRYKHAFYMVPNRLYPLYLLAKLYYEEGDTISFLDLAERIESFVPKVESANTERFRSEIRKLKKEYFLE
ncbi:MAG: tetratricopeptide repeat protein [Bacteroidaceae bacterium]|nr:tetratricopeptide repeat protein [Bacteroidaceae bacterium]